MTTLNASFTVTVNPAAPPPPPPLTLTPNGGNLPAEQVGVVDAGDAVAVVSGGQGPYTFSITGGSLPPGMNLSSVENADGSETVVISGTPTGSGAFNFILTVTDSATPAASASLAAKKTIS